MDVLHVPILTYSYHLLITVDFTVLEATPTNITQNITSIQIEFTHFIPFACHSNILIIFPKNGR